MILVIARNVARRFEDGSKAQAFFDALDSREKAILSGTLVPSTSDPGVTTRKWTGYMVGLAPESQRYEYSGDGKNPVDSSQFWIRYALTVDPNILK